MIVQLTPRQAMLLRDLLMHEIDDVRQAWTQDPNAKPDEQMDMSDLAQARIELARADELATIKDLLP